MSLSIKRNLFAGRLSACCAAAVFFVALSVFLAGCTQNKKAADDEIEADSLVTTDSIEELLLFDNTQVPETVDANFDDFFYTFVTDEEFFDKRVEYPLTVEENGKETKLAKGQWKDSDKIKSQELLTFVYTEDEDMRLLKSDSLKQVKLEWVDLSNMSCDNYLFEYDGDWKLTRRIKTSEIEEKYRDFAEFYAKFIADSVFQVNSIEEPLNLIATSAGEMYEGGISTLKRSEWSEFHSQMPMPENLLPLMDYGQNIQHEKKINMVVRCVTQPLFARYEFRRHKGKWMLHTIEY